MRRFVVIGNWKLNKTISEARAYAEVLARRLMPPPAVDVVLAPVATALCALRERSLHEHFALAAQENFFGDSGAYTGAISAPLLKDAGASYALVGHSERRQHFAESDKSCQERLQACLRAGLQPVLCVGETTAQRQAQQSLQVVQQQLQQALQGVTAAQAATLLLAYEPVWAIGTGATASLAQIAEMHVHMRQCLAEQLGRESTAVVPILYGGSVKADNAAALAQLPQIDGLLVGGASLDVDAFAQIVAAASAAMQTRTAP